jgi:uncharacterized protein
MPIIDCCCGFDKSEKELLGEMDRAGIDCAVLHPPEECFAWENEAGNERAIRAAKRHPGRFIAGITVNPWRAGAWEVIKGFLGENIILTFSPGVQGFNPAEGKLDGLLEKVRGIPVYIHTGHHSYGAPTQVAILARKFPHLNFIMGHSGATDYATDAVPVCKICPNIFIESSFARPLGFFNRCKEVGYHRAVFGSGYPSNDIAFEVSELKRLLPEEHCQGVFEANLLKLLNKGRI